MQAPGRPRSCTECRERREAAAAEADEADDLTCPPPECEFEDGCPWRALDREAPHLRALYAFAMSVMDERTEDEKLVAADGSTMAGKKLRLFFLSIERFWHFWRLAAGRWNLPMERFAWQAWEVAAIVRQAAEDAQASVSEAVWEKRRARRKAEAALRAAGAPLPPGPLAARPGEA